MIEIELPVWAALPAGVLLIVGGVVVLIGSLGLLRLPDFFSRMHPPTMGMTLGAGCILIASMLVSTALLGRPVVHEISAMILTRAALHRMRRKEEKRGSVPVDTTGAQIETNTK
jgi:multicomponent K+:H+ antiporter subunit G